jgi:hypothetical protein
MVKPIELPYLPEVLGNCKELLHFIFKVPSRLAREFSHYINNQYKLHYMYGFPKGNIQNYIQPYVLPHKINLQNVEALMSILEAAFGNPNQVGTTSVKLDKLTQGNKEFS